MTNRIQKSIPEVLNTAGRIEKLLASCWLVFPKERSLCSRRCFFYRHAVEMHIKAILLAFGPAVGIQKESVCNRGHDLAKQLSDLESVFKQNGAALSADTIATVRELQRIDPRGTRITATLSV
jgi:hypothetical protein